jgi:hypothetical protein
MAIDFNDNLVNGRLLVVSYCKTRSICWRYTFKIVKLQESNLIEKKKKIELLESIDLPQRRFHRSTFGHSIQCEYPLDTYASN